MYIFFLLWAWNVTSLIGYGQFDGQEFVEVGICMITFNFDHHIRDGRNQLFKFSSYPWIQITFTEHLKWVNFMKTYFWCYTNCQLFRKCVNLILLSKMAAVHPFGIVDFFDNLIESSRCNGGDFMSCLCFCTGSCAAVSVAGRRFV